MKQWFKEPLLHYLLLGAVIFLVYNLTDNPETDDYQIIIDDDKINHISALWEVQWKRKPSSEELKDLIQSYLKQEIMYKEALRMNLDHNDEIVKRRLSQKMEFMTSDLTKLIEPATKENLQKYFEEHKEKYKVPAGFSFEIKTFQSSKHDNPQVFAKALLEQIEVTSRSALDGYGDAIMIPSQFNKAPKWEIARELGEAFYEALDNQPLNRWVGPISSGFGEHLVFISEKENSFIPNLESVYDKVLRDYEYDVEVETKENIYRELKKKYKVIIDSKYLSDKEEAQLLSNLKSTDQ